MTGNLDMQLAQLRSRFSGRVIVDQGEKPAQVAIAVELSARGEEQCKSLLDKLLHGFYPLTPDES